MSERLRINYHETFIHQVILRVLEAAIQEGIISPEESPLIYKPGDRLGKVLGILTQRIEARGEDHNTYFAKWNIEIAVLRELSIHDRINLRHFR